MSVDKTSNNNNGQPRKSLDNSSSNTYVIDLSQYLTFNAFNEVDKDLYYSEEPLYKPLDIGDITCQKCHSL